MVRTCDRSAVGGTIGTWSRNLQDSFQWQLASVTQHNMGKLSLKDVHLLKVNVIIKVKVCHPGVVYRLHWCACSGVCMLLQLCMQNSIIVHVSIAAGPETNLWLSTLSLAPLDMLHILLFFFWGGVLTGNMQNNTFHRCVSLRGTHCLVWHQLLGTYGIKDEGSWLGAGHHCPQMLNSSCVIIGAALLLRDQCQRWWQCSPPHQPLTVCFQALWCGILVYLGVCCRATTVYGCSTLLFPWWPNAVICKANHADSWDLSHPGGCCLQQQKSITEASNQWPLSTGIICKPDHAAPICCARSQEGFDVMCHGLLALESMSVSWLRNQGSRDVMYCASCRCTKLCKDWVAGSVFCCVIWLGISVQSCVDQSAWNKCRS